MRAAWCLSVMSLAFALGCARDDSPTSRPAGATAPSVPTTAPAKRAEPDDSERAITRSTKPVTTASIYDLELSLTDESGHVRRLDSFRGHPVLVTMFYGSCASACPLLTSDLKRIERSIPEPVRSDVRILMVSFDEERDEPQVLARLKKERGVDEARWTFASTPDEQARALAGVLGIRYRKLDGGEFFHSSVITLLDREGRPQVRLDGLGGDARPIVEALSPSKGRI